MDTGYPASLIIGNEWSNSSTNTPAISEKENGYRAITYLNENGKAADTYFKLGVFDAYTSALQSVSQSNMSQELNPILNNILKKKAGTSEEKKSLCVPDEPKDLTKCFKRWDGKEWNKNTKSDRTKDL